MYCEKCGSKNESGASFCTNCGNKMVNVTTNKIESDEGNTFLWGLLGFLVPIVGLILFISFKKDRPKASKSAGKGALISAILGVVLSIISVIIMFVIGFNAAKEINNSASDYDYSTNIDDDTNYNKSTKTAKVGQKFEFSDLEITVGSAYTFTTIDNEYSSLNGETIVKVPVTIKNIDDESNHLNMFYSSVKDPNENTLSKLDSYFYSDSVGYADDLETGESYTKYLYFKYVNDGTYKIIFNDYSDIIEVNYNIKK